MWLSRTSSRRHMRVWTSLGARTASSQSSSGAPYDMKSTTVYTSVASISSSSTWTICWGTGLPSRPWRTAAPSGERLGERDAEWPPGHCSLVDVKQVGRKPALFVYRCAAACMLQSTT
mmetsp:Transcript_4410/g.10699  ORF Transcript_4410/g.10699 Transcript_4410/m.10699 type:complete len:118 (-) Transcript_4410:9-362(-)